MSIVSDILILIMIAISFGLFSSMSIWNKNTFFTHIFAHALVLPPSLCLFFNINDPNVILLFSVVFAIFFAILIKIVNRKLPQEEGSILIVISFLCTSLALILNSVSGHEIEESFYLTGNIKDVTDVEFFIMAFMTIFIVIFVIKNRKTIYLNALNPLLAEIKNKQYNKIVSIILIVQAIFVVFAIKVVGFLLISGAGIMPGIMAMMLAQTISSVFICAVGIGVVINIIGYVVGNLYSVDISSATLVIYAVILLILFLFRRKR